MQTKFIALLLSAALFSGCLPDSQVDPVTTGPEPVPYRVVKDSIETGSYLGIAIGDDAASVYPKIQSLQSSKDIAGLSVVSNIFSDLEALRERIPLYQYILLDQQRGTDSGVQITIENRAVNAIYLNSGNKLNQWPEKGKASASVRMGDAVGDLYEKLANIRGIGAYKNKFERISLLVKNLATSYDPGMSLSPQWYFGYTTGTDTMDQIQVHFEAGKVKKIRIDHYSKY